MKKPSSEQLMSLYQNMAFCEKCVLLGVDNTSVKTGCYNSVIVEAGKKKSNIILMGCPCHITHNATKKAMNAFSEINHISIEELLVFTLTTHPKEKIFLLNSANFVTRTIARS